MLLASTSDVFIWAVSTFLIALNRFNFVPGISIGVMQTKIGTLNYETKEFHGHRVKNTAATAKAEKTIEDLRHGLSVVKRSNMQLEAKNAELMAAVADKNLPTNDAYALYLRSENRRLEALCQAVSVECWFTVVLS